MMEKDLDKKFEKKIKIRIITCIFIITFGIASLVLAIYGSTKGIFMSGSDMPGFYTGIGGGLIGAGIATIVRNVIWLKDEEKRKSRQLMEYDERNLYIRNNTMAFSGYIMIAVLYLGIIVSGIFNEPLSWILLMLLGLYLMLIFVINLLLKKFY